MKLKQESGYALLVVLLTMAVGLTIGLSVIARSSTDIHISHQEEEAARAFSAAEAGLEKALLTGSGLSLADFTGVDVEVSTKAQGNDTLFNFGNEKFAAGSSQTVWLIEHDDEGELGGSSYPTSGIIDLCWGENTGISDTTPAVEASLIYHDGSDYQVVRAAYDPNTTRDNGFASADDLDGGNCGDLAFKKTLDLSAGDFGDLSGTTLYGLRLKLLYNDSQEPIAVSGSSDFPSQGKCYIAVARMTESGVSRKVQQCQFHRSPPGIFDYVLFSGGDLTK